MNKMLAIIIITLCVSHADCYFYTCNCMYDTPIISGADVLAGGLDITQLATTIERNFMSPIFEYTFTRNICMQSILSSICFKIPDQLLPYELDVTDTRSVQNVYYASYQYVTTYASSFSSSSGFITPYFGASYNYHKELYDSEYYLTSTYINQGYGYYREYLYTMTMPPAYTLDTTYVFQTALDKLPSTIKSESDNDMYNQFIKSFGTSFIVSVKMGGRFNLNQYVSEYLYQHYSDQWVVEQMGIQFRATMFNMEMGYYSNSSEYILSEDYTYNSDVEIYCIGGNIQLECSSNEWMKSIADYPGYLNLTYSPLYTLVYDDIDKHNTLRDQINKYISTGILPTYPSKS